MKKNLLLFCCIAFTLMAYTPANYTHASNSFNSFKKKKCLEFYGTYTGSGHTFTFNYNSGTGLIHWTSSLMDDTYTCSLSAGTYTTAELGEDNDPNLYIDDINGLVISYNGTTLTIPYNTYIPLYPAS